MDQPLARMVFLLLEPRSDDALVVWNWNMMDDVIDQSPIYPVLKTFSPVPGSSDD